MKQLLFAFLLAVSAIGQNVVDPYRYGQGFPLSGLVAYYRLDEVGGSGVDRLDSSGNGLSLTAVAHTLNSLANVTGIITNGVGYPGDFLQWGFLAKTNAAFDFSATSFTFSMWIKPTHTLRGVGSSVAFFFGVHTGTTQYQLVEHNPAIGALGFYVTTAGGTTNVTKSAAITNTIWSHVIVSYQNNGGSVAGNLSLRVNMGTPVTANTVTAVSTLSAPAINRFAIGGYVADSGTFDSASRFDEVGIWNRLLTEAEQTYLYNSGVGRTYP